MISKGSWTREMGWGLEERSEDWMEVRWKVGELERDLRTTRA